MSTYRLTWQPNDTPDPEVLTVEMSSAYAVELRRLLADPELGDVALWINTRALDDSWSKRLYRLARITDLAEVTP